MRHVRRTAVSAAATFALALTLAGCGGSDTEKPLGFGTPGSIPSATTSLSDAATQAPSFKEAITAAAASYSTLKNFSTRISFVMDGEDFDLTSSFANYQDKRANAVTAVRLTPTGSKEPVTFHVYRSAGKDYYRPTARLRITTGRIHRVRWLANVIMSVIGRQQTGVIAADPCSRSTPRSLAKIDLVRSNASTTPEGGTSPRRPSAPQHTRPR